MKIYKTWQFQRRPGFPRKRVMVKYAKTGEVREPKQGEFFLSGALPEVHQAPNDLGHDYHIMVLYDESIAKKKVSKLVIDLCGLIETRSKQDRSIDKSMAVEALEETIKLVNNL